MVSSVPDGKIIFKSYWQGENHREIKEINFLFKYATKLVSASVPPNSFTKEAKRLAFTCRQGSEETQPSSLALTSEQVRNLTIRLNYFPETPKESRDDEVKFKIPKDLEIGQTYILLFTSTEQSITARLIKKPEGKNAQLTLYQEELYYFLKGYLLLAIKQSLDEFVEVCTNLSFPHPPFLFICDHSPSMVAIKEKIKKLEEKTLTNLAKQVQASKNEPLQEKEVFKNCINTFGSEVPFSIMHAELLKLIGRMPNRTSRKIKLLVDRTAKRFQKSLLNQALQSAPLAAIV